MKKMLILLFLIPFTISGQVIPIDSLLSNYMNKHEASNISSYSLLKYQDKKVLLEELEPYFYKSSDKIRNKAYELVLNLSVTSQNKAIRQKGAEKVLQASKDQSSSLRRFYSKALSEYHINDFSPQFIKNVKEMLYEEEYLNKYIILLAGLLNISDSKFFFKNLSKSTKQYKNEFTLNDFGRFRWAAHLALARMGEQESISYVIQKIQQEHIHNIIFLHLKALAYVRQPETINIIIEYLLNEGKLPEMDNGARESYANRAMWHLAKVIKGFPFEYNPAAIYSYEEIQTAREWITKNRNNLQFNMDSF